MKKQKLITDYFGSDNDSNSYSYSNSYSKKIEIDNFDNLEKKVYGYNPKTNSWHCTMCGIDMGENNPRQLCRKTWCENF
jgi:hypothetical protein